MELVCYMFLVRILILIKSIYLQICNRITIDKLLYYTTSWLLSIQSLNTNIGLENLELH